MLFPFPQSNYQEYTIHPKIDGQLNLTYYKLLADVIDKNGNAARHSLSLIANGLHRRRQLPGQPAR